MTMFETVRLPVPLEYVQELEQRGGAGLPQLGGGDEVRVGGHSLGQWFVQSVEYTTAPPDYVLPVYWVTFGRNVP